jgi:hypothetical protein
MVANFSPKLEILPPPQRRLWAELRQIPESFTLWGGTALALHLGHRESVDFDFFGNEDIDLGDMLRHNPLLANAVVLQQEQRTLTCLVDRDGPVKLSFFVIPNDLTPINQPHQIPENGLRVASLIDLAASKVKVILDRPEMKDYIDIDAILQRTDITLADALSAARHVYGGSFQPLLSLKALSYFADGNLRQLPTDVRERLTIAVNAVDPTRLPSLTRKPTRTPPRDRSR